MRSITKKSVYLFKQYLIAEERSTNTVEKYVRDVTFFAEWLGGREVTKASTLEYKKALCEKYAATSVNAALAALNGFFAFKGWHDMRMKALKIQRQIFTSRDKELTKAEYERLLTAAKNRKSKKLYYLIQTLCSTGIRISELRFVTVSAVKSGQATVNCKGKMRVMLLPNELCKRLKGYMRDNNIKSSPVFVTGTGKPLDRSYIWKLLKSICKDAGVSKDKVFPHNLRHLFARTYYSLQKDIVRLADILGHSSVNTTRIYTMSTDEVCRRQIQRLGLLRI